MKEYFYHSSNLTLNYARGPKNGPPLLLLHGGSSCWQFFKIIIPALITDWQIYAIDLAGHGRSKQAKPKVLTLKKNAEDIDLLPRKWTIE